MKTFVFVFLNRLADNVSSDVETSIYASEYDWLDVFI